VAAATDGDGCNSSKGIAAACTSRCLHLPLPAPPAACTSICHAHRASPNRRPTPLAHLPIRLAAPPPRLEAATAAAAKPPLGVWDTAYFARVARCGYETDKINAFFPLLPAAMHALAGEVASLSRWVGGRAAGEQLHVLHLTVACL
jgi:hypothetical protein